MTISTRHGSFRFPCVRLRDASGNEVGWLPQSDSAPWQAFRRGMLQRLSFDDCASLCRRLQGQAAKSADALWRFVQDQAVSEDHQIASQIQRVQDQPLPGCHPVADVYAQDGAEFTVFTDAIGVKAQKPTRQKVGQVRQPKTVKRHDTDVLQMLRPDGAYAWRCEGVSGEWTLVEAARAFLSEVWSGADLSVIAITDGARSIREDLQALFGSGVRIVLDWYHLGKRVHEDLSMAAPGKQVRQAWEQAVLAHRWRGRVEEARSFLQEVTPRNAAALSDRRGYLSKHQEEIIDYERRQKAGRTIGSGQAEKAADQVVGMRQKGRGMSWTRAGSRALALLKVADLNAQLPAAA